MKAHKNNLQILRQSQQQIKVFSVSTFPRLIHHLIQVFKALPFLKIPLVLPTKHSKINIIYN